MNEPNCQALWRWPAHRLAHAIRHGAVSAREAVADSLARVDRVNPALNAIVDRLDAEALAAADAADAARRRGVALGPLHGVPVTVKVNVDCAGRATTNGVVAFKDNIAAEDSPVVANLRRAGAIIIGRTNTPAFSVRWFTENDLYGRTLNPWSAAHTPGGSSGGASSAVAAGMGAIAHGNDLAGSVRYPAYCTGVVGLRPSFGRVPAYIASPAERPLSVQMMSVQGPLARCVQDVRLALAAMSAADARDPWWVPAPLEGPALARPLRVAVVRTCRGQPVEASVHAALDRAVTWLRDAGYAVDEAATPPSLTEAAELWELIANDDCRKFMWDAVERHGDAGVKTAFGAMLAASPVLDHTEHLRALSRRTGLIRQWQRFFETHPLVLAPMSGEAPFPYGLDVEPAGMARILAAQESQFAVPLLGLPALSVPTGLVDGLPMGVQLIGPRFREDLLLDAAEAIEARCPPITPIDPR